MPDKRQAMVLTFVDVYGVIDGVVMKERRSQYSNIDGTIVSYTFVGQNETLAGHSCRAKCHKIGEMH